MRIKRLAVRMRLGFRTAQGTLGLLEQQRERAVHAHESGDNLVGVVPDVDSGLDHLVHRQQLLSDHGGQVRRGEYSTLVVFFKHEPTRSSAGAGEPGAPKACP